MKSRANQFYGEQRYRRLVKSTGTWTYTTNRPVALSETFSVITDKLNGDHRTYYAHEFKHTTTESNHIGLWYRDDPAEYNEYSGIVTAAANFELINPDYTGLYNSALSDLFDKIRSGGVGSGLDLSVDIAEAHQVVKLVRDAGSLLGNWRSLVTGHLWQSLKRRFRSGDRTASRELASAWLTWQYGVRPLYNSVYETFDALMHRRLYSHMRVTGKSRTAGLNQRSFSNVMFPGTTETVYIDRKQRVKIVGDYKIKNTVAQQLSGYTSLNPVSIAWELTPYSFVLDWVVNIGGYLRSLESACLYRTAFVTGFWVGGTLDEQMAWLQGYSNSGGTKQFVQAHADRRFTHKARYVISTAPYPYPPPFEARLGWQRLISAASLLRMHL